MRGRWILSVWVAVVLVAAGCSSSSEDNSLASSTTVEEAATTSTVEATITTSTVLVAAVEVVEVEAYDYGFRGLPSEIVAGVPLVLVNTSLTEYHDLVAFKLDDITFDIDADALSSDDEIIEDFSNLPLEAFEDEAHQAVPGWFGELHVRPGERSESKLRLLSPGRYVLIDLVPQGADPDAAAREERGGQPYQVEGGPPGYHHGMIAVLTVTLE
jgi:hypothetical protein